MGRVAPPRSSERPTCDRFAWDEGEGDRTRAHWLDAHTRCFTRALAAMGQEMHPDIEVVFERFEVV